MTMAELMVLLGYRSKTSIVRLMKGNVSIRSMETFAEKMRAYAGLSQDEEQELDEAVEIIRWQDDYYSSQEMLKFVGGHIEPGRDIMLECVDSAPAKMLMSERYSCANNIRIIILNSQYVPVFPYIKTLLRDRDACVEHYMLVDNDTARTIRGMNSLLSVVYESRYNGYICMSDIRNRHRGLLMADMMHVAYDTPDGEHLEDMVVFDRDDHAYVHSALGNGMLRRILAIPREKFVPIKRTYFERAAMEDYVQFSQDYARLEYNRTIYKLKPDFGVDYIPVDILASAVREGPMFHKNNVENILGALVRIYEKRVQNTYEKRRATHAIMKRSALWKFVRSGKISDHFWGMRPFTMAERGRILKTILEQYDKNPYFHIYFLKDNQFLRDGVVAYYENLGMLIPNPETSYNLAGGHSEVLVTHPEFLRLYKDFFLNNLIRQQVISHAETRQFLLSLIEYCEREMEGNIKGE